MEKISLKMKRISKIFHVVMFAYLVACFFILNAIYANFYDTEKNNIIEYAESTKLFIDVKDINALDVEPSDIEKESYQFLKRHRLILNHS